MVSFYVIYKAYDKMKKLMLLMLLLAPLAYGQEDVDLYLFFAKTCPHCAEERDFLSSIESNYPTLNIHSYEISENAELWRTMCKAYGTEPYGVPMTFIGDKYFTGFADFMAEDIEEAIRDCVENGCADPGTKAGLEPPKINESSELKIPFIGNVDANSVALGPFTFLIAIVDGFNPCTMWVLSFLLALLIHVHNRKKIIVVGSIFLLVVYLIYFLFMSAWLNLFLYLGYIEVIRIMIAIIAIIAGLINVKDFFWFKKGLSLTISDKFKPKLFEKMRSVVKQESLFLTAAGTVVLASFASLIELPCTSGFPAIYTKILSMQGLAGLGYYAYIMLYCLFYIIPLATVIGIFAYFMKGQKMTEKHGRILKLIGGAIMLLLGLVLLINPNLLMFG